MRTWQQRQDSRGKKAGDKNAGTGQLEKNSWERTAVAGKSPQEAGTGQLEKTVRKGQAGRNRQEKKERT
jgi:hypothetical protein